MNLNQITVLHFISSAVNFFIIYLFLIEVAISLHVFRALGTHEAESPLGDVTVIDI